jgi:energy-coupling factor transporter ATP-binding protein EcfA2
MSLPQTSIPGIDVRERVAFGRNIRLAQESHQMLPIGKLSHLGNITQKEVSLNVEELSKHVFITGSTGSGKSNTTYLLVNNLLNKEKKILIVEPTKGDYKKVFGGRKGITVYGTRPDEKNLLRINPFSFPEGIRIDEHVEHLVEIFGVCWPMYAAMPAVLKDSILAAYKACGWNLMTSTCNYGRLFPTIKDVVTQLKRIISSSDYSADTKGDYIGALQTRLQSLTNGIYSFILTSDSLSYTDLYENNAIIDLHRIGSSETRSLLMGLIVLGLTEWRTSQGEDSMDEKLKYVTVLEEAHCILPRVSKQQSQESSNVVGKSVEMIASAIAEMRSYGQGFIIVDQSPSAVDEAAIRNTNTKIIMNLPDGEDREIAGKSMGVTKELQIAELAKLSTGEAVVFQRGWSEAVMTSIYEMKKEDRIPLLSKDNRTQQMETKTTLSDDFISFFINGNSEVNENTKHTLTAEILASKCSACSKVILLDELNNKPQNPFALYESILDFITIKEYFIDVLNQSTTGSTSLIWSIRNLLAEKCDIIDTNIQNNILSMTFKWASIQNNKWHTICSQCMPNPKK